MRIFTAKEWISPEENITINKHVHKIAEEIHSHDFIEISYIFSGEGYQQINKMTRHVQRGDLLFLNISDTHSFYPIDQLGVLNCLIKPEFISNELINFENAADILALTTYQCFQDCKKNLSPMFSLYGKEIMELENIFETMLAEYDNKETGYKNIIRGYFDILLTKIFRHIKNSANENNIHEEVLKITPQVLAYIEKNYKRKLTLDELARKNFYNPTYFSTVFKNCFGMTLTDYVVQKRIHAAMQYIEDTDLTIDKIFKLVGFRNKNQFYKKFTDNVGLTPHEYRMQSKKNKDINE